MAVNYNLYSKAWHFNQYGG